MDLFLVIWLVKQFSVSLRIQRQGQFKDKKNNRPCNVFRFRIQKSVFHLFLTPRHVFCLSSSFHWRLQEFIRQPSATTEEKIWAKLTSPEKVEKHIFCTNLSFTELLADWLSSWARINNTLQYKRTLKGTNSKRAWRLLRSGRRGEKMIQMRYAVSVHGKSRNFKQTP